MDTNEKGRIEWTFMLYGLGVFVSMRELEENCLTLRVLRIMALDRQLRDSGWMRKAWLCCRHDCTSTYEVNVTFNMLYTHKGHTTHMCTYKYIYIYTVHMRKFWQGCLSCCFAKSKFRPADNCPQKLLVTQDSSSGLKHEHNSLRNRLLNDRIFTLSCCNYSVLEYGHTHAHHMLYEP